VAGSESRGTGDGGEEGDFTGRAAIGYDHGYEAEGFHLGLALDAAVLKAWPTLPGEAREGRFRREMGVPRPIRGLDPAGDSS
jgi:hypothetical protein